MTGKHTRKGLRNPKQLASDSKHAAKSKNWAMPKIGIKKRSSSSGRISSKTEEAINHYQEVIELIEASAQKYFSRRENASDKTDLSKKYDDVQVSELIQEIILSLKLNGKKLTKDSDLGADTQKILKDFIEKQSKLFKRHYPYFHDLLKKQGIKDSALSMKDIECISSKQPKTHKEVLNKAIKWIQANDLAFSLVIIALKKINHQVSPPAQASLHETLKLLDKRVQATIKEIDTLIKKPKGVNLDLSNAVKEELMRAKRFINTADHNLIQLNKKTHAERSIHAWAQEDLQVSLGLIEEKVKIASLIGDHPLADKLKRLRSKILLNLKYPNTIQLKNLKKDHYGFADPIQVKELLTKRLMDELETIGDKDPQLERKMNSRYTTNSDELMNVASKIFWVPYPNIKKTAKECLNLIRSTERIIHNIDGLSEHAIRPRKSYERELIKKLEPASASIHALKEHHEQAKEKAETKGHDFDFTITQLIQDIEESMPKKESLKKAGYLN